MFMTASRGPIGMEVVSSALIAAAIPIGIPMKSVDKLYTMYPKSIPIWFCPKQGVYLNLWYLWQCLYESFDSTVESGEVRLQESPPKFSIRKPPGHQKGCQGLKAPWTQLRKRCSAIGLSRSSSFREAPSSPGICGWLCSHPGFAFPFRYCEWVRSKPWLYE